MNEDTENNQIDQVEKTEVVLTEQPVYMFQYWVDPILKLINPAR